MKSIPEALLVRLVSDVLDVPPDGIAGNSNFGDFPNWDSMTYINLIMALESELGVTFSHADVLEMDSLEGLKAVLKKNGVEIA